MNIMIKKSFFKKALFLFVAMFVLINTSVVFSQSESDNSNGNLKDYYADIIININERGETTIKGLTNDDNLLGDFDNLTSKDGKYWVFNLSVAEKNFSDALFEINFPSNVVLTYIKSSAQINIGARDDITFVKGILKDKPLNVLVQYYFVEEDKSGFSWLFLGSIFLIIIGAYLLFFTNSQKKFSVQNLDLNDRQKQILNILYKNKDLNQNALEEMTGLPKSSLSRNLDSLEKKGFITKIKTGYSNKIVLNESFIFEKTFSSKK